MYRCARIRITDLNPHLMCVLCGGYFVDATTVIECLHSFCRTCIVRYLESSKFCPICDVQVHKTRPLLNIRSDKTLQDLVYKLVPGLFEEEMRRRREFMAQHPEVKVKHLNLEDRGLAHMTSVHTIPEENISLVLEMAPNGHPAFNDMRKQPTSHKRGDRRYLLCPCDVSVGHLKKFIRLKFNLPHNFEIDMFHPKSPEAITDEFTLLDITFVFSWNRKKPLRIYYCVFEKPAPKKRTAAATSASPNNSVSLKKARMDKFGMKPTNAAIVVSSTTTTATTNSLTAQKLLPGVAASVKVNLTDEKNEASVQVSDFIIKRPNQENGTLGKVEQVNNIDRVIAPTAAVESGIIASSTPPGVPDMHSTTEVKENIRSNIMRTLKVESSSSSRSSSPKVDSPTASPKPNGNSRTASPKLANGRTAGVPGNKAASGSNSRTASPKPTNVGNGRTASPKLTNGGNSRTASPKLSNGRSSGASSPKTVNARNGRTDSPKLALDRVRADSPKLLSAERSKASSPKLTNGRNSRTASPRTVSEQSSGTASPKPSNGRANGTSSPKLLNGRHQLSGPTVALVSVEQSITVDVNVGTETTSSSSEASPGVTSPGAEDRAHSVTMADLPDNLKNGPHVCNTAAFAPRPLPDLKPPCLGQGRVKGVGQGRSKMVQAKQSKNDAKTKARAVTSQPSLKSTANNKSKDKGKNKNKSALYCPL